MNNKKSVSMEFMVMMLIVTIAALLIAYFGFQYITKGKDANLGILKHLLGGSEQDAAKQKEQERINNELLANAENTYSQFESEIKNCVGKSSDKVCSCAIIDFVNLNNFFLRISIDSDNHVLELLDSDSVHVKDKKSELGNFYLVAVNPSSNPINYGDKRFYDSPYYSIIAPHTEYKSITFSKDSMIIKRPYDVEKSKGHMEKLNFIRIPKNTQISGSNLPKGALDKDAIIIDENDYGFGGC